MQLPALWKESPGFESRSEPHRDFSKKAQSLAAHYQAGKNRQGFPKQKKRRDMPSTQVALSLQPKAGILRLLGCLDIFDIDSYHSLRQRDFIVNQNYGSGASIRLYVTP